MNQWLALDGGQCSAACTGYFIDMEIATITHWIGGGLEFSAWSGYFWTDKNSWPYSKLNKGSLDAPSVAYTNCAVLAPNKITYPI